MGFEPMKELPLYTLSKRAPSTTRPPLLIILNAKDTITLTQKKPNAIPNILYFF